MDRKKIKPKNDSIVFDPIAKKNIDSLGQFVIFDSYWQRRLLDNEIEIIDETVLTDDNLDKPKKGK
jgi:hypothetical protein